MIFIHHVDHPVISEEPFYVKEINQVTNKWINEITPGWEYI